MPYYSVAKAGFSSCTWNKYDFSNNMQEKSSCTGIFAFPLLISIEEESKRVHVQVSIRSVIVGRARYHVFTNRSCQDIALDRLRCSEL
jgi:hypothetical protein